MSDVSQNAIEPPEWLDITTACQFIGGSRPIHAATFYRGVRAGIYPAPESRGHNIRRINRAKLTAALERLREPDNAAA